MSHVTEAIRHEMAQLDAQISALSDQHANMKKALELLEAVHPPANDAGNDWGANHVAVTIPVGAPVFPAVKPATKLPTVKRPSKASTALFHLLAEAGATGLTRPQVIAGMKGSSKNAASVTVLLSRHRLLGNVDNIGGRWVLNTRPHE